MNNDTRPTPETDAHIKRMETEDFDVELALTKSFARTLERERDEARRNAEVERLSGSAVVAICKRQESDITDLNQRLIDRTADMLAKVVELEERSRALESQKEQWRMSSVCREKDAQIEAMREAIKTAHNALNMCARSVGGVVYQGIQSTITKLKPFIS